MKADNKILNIAAGVVFLWNAVNGIRNVIAMITSGYLFYGNPLNSVISLYGTVVLVLMGIWALRQKQRGKVLNILGLIYIGYILVNLLTTMMYGFSIRRVLSVAVLAAAFFLPQKASGAGVFNVTDTVSEAAKVKAQTEKQTTVYDEQLRDGILTQEEYDQIMQNKV